MKFHINVFKEEKYILDVAMEIKQKIKKREKMV